MALIITSGRRPSEDMLAVIMAASAEILDCIGKYRLPAAENVKETLEMWKERITPIEAKLERLRERLRERKRAVRFRPDVRKPGASR